MDDSAKIFLAVSLIIIMIGMGLSLTIADFRRVLKFPKAVFLGFLNQIILLPLIAYFLIWGFNEISMSITAMGFNDVGAMFSVGPELAVGVMILSACPGGPTSNLLSHLAKGDTALSVTLTAINSLVTIITIPLIVNFSLHEFATAGMEISAPIGQIAGSLVAIIAVPLAIGMTLNKYKSSLAAKMDKPVKVASIVILAVIIIGLTVKERAHIVDYVQAALMVVLALNVTTMVIGFITAKIAKLSFKQAITICLESGNQNGTLAIAIGGILSDKSEFIIAAAVYSLIMYFTASIPIIYSSKKIQLSER